MKSWFRSFSFLAIGLVFYTGPAYGVVKNATLSTNSIAYETVGSSNVTINYEIDAISNVEIDIFFLQNVSDVPSAANQVAQITQNGVPIGSQPYMWDALWLLGEDRGRTNGNFQVIVNANDGTTTSSFSIGQLLNISSLDIHNVTATPSFDADGNPVLPYVISYALAKDSRVSVSIEDSSGTIVRTLIKDQPRYGERVKPANVLTWNGLNDEGRPVALDTYNVLIEATSSAPGNTDRAIPRRRQATIQSLASLDSDVKKTFEDHAFVYPNPVRIENANTTCGHAGCFEVTAVRNNATISLKLYTIAGDLVLSKSSGVLATGEIFAYSWDGTNQSGKKVGRGLYYFVAREDDENGTLQTVKKMAVIR